jgi:hypothetical protein
MQSQPIPASALKVIAWICPAHLREEIEGDLIQKFNRDNEKLGFVRANLKSLLNSLLYFRPSILLRREKTSLKGQTGASFAFNYKIANHLIGWVVFSIALLTYCFTLEETASFWDCSEFIATSYKLQVPHPPGAPLFLMLGRFFSFLSFGDATKVAYAINLMSALSSAFTILLLYWSIVLLSRKLFAKDAVGKNRWLIVSAGVVGSLAYAFSDTFWFSAVEAEVYAMSSMFAAYVVWAMLKWDAEEDESRANRWLILIAYAMGLSIGVHLLNLLTLPAIALIYYFKKYKVTFWGVVITLLLSVMIVFLVSNFVVQGLPSIAGYFEIFFVNTLGLFFGSGAIVFVLVIGAVLVLIIRYSHLTKKPILNTFSIAFTFVIIGYCSYAMIIVRSNFDPLINENAPKDVMSVVRYLKREQYVSPPLLFGPNFTSQPVGYHYGDPIYVKGKSKYEISERRFRYEYAPGDETFFPRLWYPDAKEDYKNMLGLKEGQRPTFLQNLTYFFRHQVGTMNMRYFFWNFAGRSGDDIGADWLRPSEWLKKIPATLNNRARNNFFMIPLILGIIGMLYQFKRDVKNSSAILLLFAMLGIALVVYLNSPPTEPRERDYIYVGSYYAFAIWIGISVIAIAEAFAWFIKNKKLVLASAFSVGIAAPALMAVQGWDDHDRSNRFFSVDAAYNELNSCDKNGILFTGGDNDTFPLWYAQETENCRTDVRALVLSYSNAAWYIDQTTRQAYQSPPFKYTLKPKDYASGANAILMYADFKIESIDVNEYLNLLAKDYAPLRSDNYNLIPSKVLTIAVNKKEVLAKGIIPKGMEDFVVDKMELHLKSSTLEKADLLLLDLLATNKWERPIYVNSTSIAQVNFDLTPYAVQEGNTYRILPVKNPRSDRNYLVDTEKTYDLMLNKFKYRGLDDESVYYTNDYKMQVQNQRVNFNSLADALIDKGEIEKAANALHFSLQKMPANVFAYDPSVADTVSLLFKAGEQKTATEIAVTVGKQTVEAASFLIADSNQISYELRKNLFMLNSMQRALAENQEVALAEKLGNEYNYLIESMQSKAMND